MIQIEEILSESIVRRLGWALVHFVWQGIVIAILFALGMRMLRRGSSNSRYAIGCGAMMIMILLPIVTVLRTEAPAPTGPKEEVTAVVSPASPIMPGPLPTAAVAPELVEKEVRPERSPESPVVLSGIPARKPHRKAQPSGALERALPWAVAGWLIGVVFLSLRLLGGWAQMQRLKGRFVKPVAQRWQQVFINLSRRIQLSRPVRVLESALAQVPTVIGWFKPAILLPTSALTGLSSEQVEALLAHELAHIRRHDYLVNLIQTIVETLLFYHPAVWWVSHRVRIERENCCDDLAVVVCGNEVAYARALTEMEQLRGVARRPAVAASGGSLLHRIRRLLGKRGRESNRSAWWLAGVLVLSSVLVLGTAVRMSGSQPRQESSTEGSTGKKSGENSQGLTFGGLDLTGVPATTDPNKLADLFEPGPESGPHYLREGVTIVHQDGVGDNRGYLGSVYWAKEKNVFYIRYGPPRWTESRKYYGPFQGDPREVLRLEGDSGWLDKLWVTWIADQETVKSLTDGNPGIAAKAIVRGWTPAALETSEWEIRTADGKQRVARIPFAWPNSPTMMLSGGKRIEGGRSRTCRLEPNRSQLAWVNSLEEGEYLLGWNVRGRRVSNVLRFAVKNDYDIKQEPLLQLVEIEPAPGEALAVLALRAYRRTAEDPAPLMSAVAYATLIVDGRERRVTHMTWTGPDVPLKVGGQTCYFLHLEYYSPPIEPGRKHVVVARVGGHESAPLTVTSERRLSEQWDRDTIALGPPPGLEAPEVVLSGKVISTHGKPSRGYDVSLVAKGGLRETVETNDDGTYAFHAQAVPAGRYEVSAHPHGQGQPMLTVRGIDIGEEQPRELDLNLEGKYSFGGRVTYPDGLPAQGWTVMGTWPSSDGSAEYNNFATADMDGRYTLRAPYEVASFVGWGGKQVRRGVKAGQKDVDFAAPAKEGGGTEGMLTASGENGGYVRRYGHDGYELEAGFTPEKAEILLGEPVFLTFSVKNISNKAYGFFIGGDIRGSVRHNKFRIAAVDEEGRPVRDPYSYNHFGGFGGEVELQPGESYTERLYLGFWCEFEKVGTYTVTCKRTLDFDGSDAKYPAAPIVTAFKLTIGHYDKERMSRVIADLGKRLVEGDKKEVHMATLGLAAIDDEQVIPHLAVSLTKGDFENRLPAVKGLSRFSTDAAATALIKALKDPDYVVSEAAGKALQEMKTRDLAVDTLLEELGSPLSSERALAARALGYTMAEGALTPLIMAMDDAVPAVRAAAGEALGHLGLQQAIPVLEKRVARQDMGMRVAAAKGLMALGKPLQVEWLVPVIRNTTDINNQDFHESIRLIRLYGKERAAAALVSCLNFDDPSPRSYYNFFLILGIEYSPNGPKYYTKFYHDPNTDGTPQQIQGNREILAALKDWLAEFELEKGKIEVSPEAGGEAAATATAVDEEVAKAASVAWGEAVNGLQAGLGFELGERPYHIGERVSFVFSLRNVSQETIPLSYTAPAFLGWTATVVGEGGEAMKIVGPTYDTPVQLVKKSLGARESFVLGHPAFTIRPSAWEGTIKETVLHADPGKYKVCQSYRFQAMGLGDWSGELRTGELEMEVVPAEAVAASEESSSDRSGEAENGLVWGKAVNGLRAAVEFMPEKATREIGEALRCRFHVQNMNDKAIQIARVTGQTDPGHWIIEGVEGGNARLAWTIRWTGRRKIDRRSLNPGEKVVLDSEEPLGIQKSVKERVTGTKEGIVVDRPGRYSFRYLLRFQELEAGDWSGELETGKVELRIDFASEKIVEAAVSPEETVRYRWGGKPVDGVSCRLWPGRFQMSGRVHWTADESPYLRAQIRNDGSRDLAVSLSPELCELSVNNRWYQMLVDVDAKTSAFPPGKLYTGITIPFDRRWHTKDTNQPLELSIGRRYIIQAAFTARPTKEDAGGPIRFVSNVCEIEILPARKAALVWGETVNGLRAAIEVVPESQSYWMGSWVNIRFHVENVGDQRVCFAREMGYHPDHPSHWMIESSDGSPIPCYQNSLWDAAGETDRTVLEPGEAAVLEYVELVSLGRPDEGGRSSSGRTAEVKKAGRYFFRYKLAFEQKQPGDWSGELETGKLELTINVPSKRDQTI